MFFRRHSDALFPEALPEGEAEPDPKDAGGCLHQAEWPAYRACKTWLCVAAWCLRPAWVLCLVSASVRGSGWWAVLCGILYGSTLN